MNSAARAAVAAFSLANLLFLRVWYELNHLQHDPLHQYFLARPAGSADYIVAIAGAALLALLLYPLLRLTLLRPSPFAAAAGAVITGLLLVRVLYLVTGLSETVPEILWWKIQDEAGALWESSPAITALLLAAAALVLFPASRRLMARAAPVLVILLTLLMPFGALMIGHAAMHAARSMELPAANARTLPVRSRERTPGAPRVIVAVFDELDYRLAFVEPPAGLPLRGLARLRAASLFATHAFPPSNATAISMPAMLVGQHVLNIQADGWDTLNLYLEKDRIVSFKNADTLFHRAARAGFSSGVIGWYHPYCRLFPMTADCHASTAYGYATSYPGSGILDVLAAQWRQILPYDKPFAALRYRSSIERFQKMLVNPSLDLVFAHFAIPHVPYIYDAALEQLADSDRMAPVSRDSVSYFSNLRLVDRVIDTTLDTMQRSCADCILIVTADHWWRWSRHYDGKTDRRVPFAVYAVKGGRPIIHEKKFNNELLATLVMQLLERKLGSHADIARWLNRNGRPRSPSLAPWMLDEDRLATSLDPPAMPLPGSDASRE